MSRLIFSIFSLWLTFTANNYWRQSEASSTMRALLRVLVCVIITLLIGSKRSLNRKWPCADPEGGGDRGPGPPLENYKNIGFLSIIDRNPLKITKLPIQHSMLGHHRHASETPFPWQAVADPLLVVFGSFLPSSN